MRTHRKRGICRRRGTHIKGDAGRRIRRRRAGLVAIVPIVGGSIAAAMIPPPPQLPPVPVPPENPITEAKRVLGKALFWDVQLSSDNTVACGTCHRMSAGSADPAPASHPGADGVFGTADDRLGSPGIVRQARGAGFVSDPHFGLARQVTGRSAQSITMSMFAGDLFWDGRASTTFVDPQTEEVAIATGGGLESHALGPPVNDIEMAHEGRDWDEVADRLVPLRPLAVAADLPPDVAAVIGSETRYPELFAAAFGDPGISARRIAFAIATYERTLVPDQSPYDRDEMTEAQLRGFSAFNSPITKCTECHVPPQFTNHEFRAVGVRPPGEDPGRMEVTGDPADAGAFKVPSLRNVGLKRSFMRDGRFTTLREVFAFYHAPTRQQFRQNIDSVVPRVRVPPHWRGDLEVFLAEALTDPRAANETFPFDRPTLHDELPPNPRAITEGTPGRGGHVPAVIAFAPPSLGNEGFAIGLTGGLGGATARLIVSDEPPVDGRLMTPSQVVGPFVLPGRDAGVGSATWRWPIPDDAALDGARRFVQWVIDDAAADGGLARSPVVEIRLFERDPSRVVWDDASSVADATR